MSASSIDSIHASIVSAPSSNPIHAPIEGSTVCDPTYIPNVSTPTPIVVASSGALVKEEMRFWSKFNSEAEGEDFIFPAAIVAEALKGTRFAMHCNVALLQRENAILKNSLSQVM